MWIIKTFSSVILILTINFTGLFVLAQSSTPESEKLNESKVESTPRQLFIESSPAVVLVRTNKGSGTRGSGTGFFVSDNGLVLTAAHVVEGATAVSIKTSTNEVYEKVSLLAIDSRKDIAILRVPGFDLPYLKLGNSNQSNPGDSLFVISNPTGERLLSSISDGILSGVRDLGDGYSVIQMTAPVSDGSSGGPVFNSNREVIGIVSFKLIKGESLNFAIPINYARGLMSPEILGGNVITKWEGGVSEVMPSKAEENIQVSINGLWKARKDGQILRIKDLGEKVSVINVTYPEVNTEAWWFGDVVVGKIHGRLFRNWYALSRDEFGNLLFHWISFKSKDSREKNQERIKESLAKKPYTVLYRID